MNTPAVRRELLLYFAGAVWTAVGIALSAVAVYWLVTAQGSRIVPLISGLAIGVVVYYFGFLRLVRKNKTRMNLQAPGKSRVCLFAFQSWHSYITVAVMIALGYTLRHLPVSRLLLVPIYLAIGVGLILASLHYYSEAQR